MFFTSPTDGYVTEFSGKILKTTNGGTVWSALPSGTTTNLQAIYFTSTNNGVVAGDNGTVRITSNAGASWSGVTSGTTTDYLTGMDFYDANNGVIVGGNIGANTGIILTTANGGASWSTYSPGTSRLSKVDFLKLHPGYAVGLTGTLLKYSNNGGILEQDENITCFSNYPNPFTASTTIDCKGYSFTDSPLLEIYDVTGKLIRKQAA